MVFWFTFMVPTEDGTKVATAVRALQRIQGVGGGNAPLYSAVRYEVIRNTLGSVWSNDIAMKFAPTEDSSVMGPEDAAGGEHLNKRLLAARSPAVLMAMAEGFNSASSKCMVRVSAQALNHEGTPYARMATTMGSREDTFMLLLAHETAHCFWNPAMDFERGMQASLKSSPGGAAQVVALLPLAWNISESYADAYALMLGLRLEESFYQRAILALGEFRAMSSAPHAPHNTTDAIAAARVLGQSLPDRKSPMSANWDITNRYAMSSALTGSMRWLIRQGVSRDDAVSRIATVLQGQKIEFQLKTVGGQDYLVALRAPNPQPQDPVVNYRGSGG